MLMWHPAACSFAMNLLFCVNWLCPKSPDVRHLGSDYDKVSSVEVKEPAARITICAVLFYSVVFFPTFFLRPFTFYLNICSILGSLPQCAWHLIGRESETWQCLLCTNLKEIIDAPPSPAAERRVRGLSRRDQKLAERIVLELYCQYEPSLHFRETVGPEVLFKLYYVLYSFLLYWMAHVFFLCVCVKGAVAWIWMFLYLLHLPALWCTFIFQWGEHLICCFHKPCFYCRRQCNKHKFVKFSKESRQIKNFWKRGISMLFQLGRCYFAYAL